MTWLQSQYRSIRNVKKMGQHGSSKSQQFHNNGLNRQWSGWNQTKNSKEWLYVEIRVWEAYENLTWAQPCLQAGFGTAPSCRREWGQNAAQLLCVRKGCLHHDLQIGAVPVLAESIDRRFPPFLVTTMPHHPENCCPTSLFVTVYNKLTGGGGGCCVSPPECQPTWPQLFACLSFVLSQFPIAPS
jgi:hypothetical protein